MDLLKNLDDMITAEEFLKDKFRKIYLSHPESFKDKISEKIYLELHVTGRVNGTEQNYPEMMIEFAKLHVEAALKKASEEAKTFDVYNESCGDLECKVTFIKKDSILNSYSLENIK